MKLNALWLLMAFVPALRADPVTPCTAGAASVPVFDVTSVSGAVGDYTLDCTGGNPTPVGQPSPEVNVIATLFVPVLTPGTWILTEDGVNTASGTLLSPDQVEFLDVPFNPPGPGGHLDFEVEGISVNPSLEPPGFQFNEDLAIDGDTSLTIDNPQQLVAVNAVPEPSFTLVLAGFGLGAMWFARRMNYSK
jgi:hypothetical protein